MAIASWYQQDHQAKSAKSLLQSEECIKWTESALDKVPLECTSYRIPEKPILQLQEQLPHALMVQGSGPG